MRSECNRCGEKVGESCAAGMITTGMPAAMVTAVVCGLLLRSLPWIGFAALPLWFLLTYLFWEGPRWATAFRNRFRPGPRCGARDWKRPYYGGFGL